MFKKASDLVAEYTSLGRKTSAQKSELEHYGLYADVPIRSNLYGVIIFLLLTIYLVFQPPAWIDTLLMVGYYIYTTLMVIFSVLCAIGAHAIFTGKVEKHDHVIMLGKQLLSGKGKLSVFISTILEWAVVALCLYTQAYVLAAATALLAVSVGITRDSGVRLGYVLLGAARAGESDYKKVTQAWLKSRQNAS